MKTRRAGNWCLTPVFLVAMPLVAAPMIGGCPVLPADNVWNTRVDSLPVHPNSAAYVTTIGPASGFHMDFGSGLYPEPPDPTAAPIGIPFVTVPGTQSKVQVAFGDEAGEESDPGPYPIPPDAPIEGVGPADADGDRHVLVVDRDNCVLYETFYAFPVGGGASWSAYSGAIFDLKSNGPLRPSGWTSADAAGLPILPGLVRYDEAAAGAIEHALRFTAPATQQAFIWPARHFASSSADSDRPPMGLRLRLKASVNIDGFSPRAKAIAQAMKTYGIMLADNGSRWFVSGAPDARWDNDELHELDVLEGGDFEAVDTSYLMAHPDSGQVLNPLNSHGMFVIQQYRDFLGRPADAGGVTFWSGQIASGAQSRGQVIESFFASPEFQGVIAPVARLYFAYFLRIPDYAGLDFWIRYYRDGNSLEAISNFFAQSAEFSSTYGALSNSQFVTLVYNNVLGRAPDAGGLTFWTNQLDSGALSRGQVMLGFSESAEYRDVSNSEVYTTMMYIGMLRRAPDAGGFAFWVDYLDDGNSGLALIDGFLASPEYASRFLP